MIKSLFSCRELSRQATGHVVLAALVCAVSAMSVVSAASAQGRSTQTVIDVGPSVTSALEMQASGRNGVAATPMLDDVALRVYERYLESFDHPIPQFFQEQTFTPGGGAANGGNAGSSGSR